MSDVADYVGSSYVWRDVGGESASRYFLVEWWDRDRFPIALPWIAVRELDPGRFAYSSYVAAGDPGVRELFRGGGGTFMECLDAVQAALADWADASLDLSEDEDGDLVLTERGEPWTLDQEPW